jgi:uncharacterized Zn-finger protein
MIIKNLSKEKLITKKIESDINTICCSGGDKHTGHPAVYYNFGEKKQITCQYCGTIYLKSK